jgi:hypothetical protein
MSNMTKPAAGDGGSRQCIGSGQNLTADSNECRNIAQQATLLSPAPPAKGKRPRRSHIFDRDDDDFYVEPAWCSARLFAVEPFAGLIWDPAAGSGTIPRAARAAGLSNFAGDIANRGSGPRQDFLIAIAPAEAFNVVTNPPFRLARAFVERALELGAKKTAMIFPTARLNAARWLEPLPLAKIFLLTPRPSMPPGEVIARGEKPGGGKMDFCWLVFDRNHSGPIELRWLHRDGSGT